MTPLNTFSMQKCNFLNENDKKENFSKEQSIIIEDGKIKVLIPQKFRHLLPNDKVVDQMNNLLIELPDIQSIIGLPDLHHGYCFSIGSVVTTENIVVPEGIGNDINCGVRMVKCNIDYKKVNIKYLLDRINNVLPVGIGREKNNPIVKSVLEKINKIRHKKMSEREFMNGILDQGIDFLINNRIINNQKDMIESYGKVDANSYLLSQKIKARGLNQLGSLGAGNHFLEIQKVDKIYDNESQLSTLLFQKDEMVMMIHTGSRGLGYLVCEEAIRDAQTVTKKRTVSDIDSSVETLFSIENSKIHFFDCNESEKYLLQMGCAVNYAFVNRALIHLTVDQILEEFGIKSELVYDVGHNSFHKEMINGKIMNVHRKGASRALPPDHSALSNFYRKVGQPVPIGGSMGTASYLLLSKDTEKSNFSCPHGAGRIISRNVARKKYTMKDVEESMNEIYLLCKSANGAIEEHPNVYKNIDDIATATTGLNLAKKICKCRPLGVIKG